MARPNEFAAGAKATQSAIPPTEPLSSESCPFCVGHEALTPPAIATDPAGATDHWLVRVVPNKFPALEPAATPRSMEASCWGQVLPGLGTHEVVIESNQHVERTGEISVEQLTSVLRIYRQRLVELARDGRWRYAQVFKNVGKSGGASLAHLHSQILATATVPTTIKTELDHAARHAQATGRCLFCDLIERERSEGVRIVSDEAGVVVLCPFASRLPYETWVLPTAHDSHFEDSSDEMLAALAAKLHAIVKVMEEQLPEAAYNYLIHTAPFDSLRGPHYHWHVEIIPRVTMMAGFELGSGYFINPVSPEKAAAALKRMQLESTSARTLPMS
jgi:UDPglucose--hexose-1-phosphate uridylyltransferase